VLQHTPNSEESIGKLWEMVKPGGALVIDHYRRTRAQLPPPIGNALWLWRKLFLALPRRKRWGAVKRLVDTFFPLYWRFRDGYLIRRLLDRVAGINFYYPALPLGSREAFYEWALLDTHDASTDYYRHFRTPRSIARTLKRLGAEEIDVRIGGNGVEAFCRKPTTPLSRR
jgi:hypothetical protein